MKSSIFFLAAMAFHRGLVVDALVLEKKSDPAVVAFDLYKVLGNRASGSLRPELSRRMVGGYDEVAGNKENFLWTVSLQIGTPPQTQRCQLDTGSSDLVVETHLSNLCQSQPAVCTGRGAYNANSSSTYHYVNSEMSVAYGGGDSATGDFVTDSIGLGSDIIQNVQFGVMYHTTAPECIMGVSFSEIEGSVFSYSQQYANIPQALVQQGHIKSNAYSVWLNDDTSATGKLLFGGVDASKYYGQLVTLPFVTGPNDVQVRQTYVTLQGVQMTNSSGQIISLNESLNVGPALLDTGTTFIYLPPTLAESIYIQLGATQLGNPSNPHFVLCSQIQSTETVDFLFNGITVNVPLRQLIYDLPGASSQTYCELGIVASSSFTILGDTFLTSVYAVFDLDNKQVHIARAVYGFTTDDIYQITSGPNAVPNVMGVPVTTENSMTSMISVSSSVLSSTATMMSPDSSSSSSTSLAPASPTILTTIHTTSSSLTTFSFSSSSYFISNIERTFKTFSTSSITSLTRSTTPTITSTTATASPTMCHHDNCYRAIKKSSYTALCSSYLAGSVYTAPAAVSKACYNSTPRISSACSCVQTRAS